MAQSTIPAFKAQLQTSLSARTGLRNVQVSYGAPLPAPAREFVWLGDVEGEQEPASLGAQRREETYRLTVVFSVLREGNDQKATTERAFELAAELEDELRDSPTMNDTVRYCQVTGPFQLEEMSSDQARGALLTVTVAASARI